MKKAQNHSQWNEADKIKKYRNDLWVILVIDRPDQCLEGVFVYSAQQSFQYCSCFIFFDKEGIVDVTFECDYPYKRYEIQYAEYEYVFCDYLLFVR